jgi:hypothetical protein
MLWNNVKRTMREMPALVKKNILMIILSSLFLFAVIWLGSVITVITSRSILDPVSVKVEGLAPANLSSIRVLATLSRAGNTMNLTRVLEEDQNEWNNPSNTFIQRLLIGLNSEDLEQFSSLTVALGAKNFVYPKDQFLAEWKKLETESDEWYMSDINKKSEYAVYEAPENVKVKPWNLKIPLVSSLLSSLNFRGSEFLVQAPLISSIETFLLFAIVVIILFFILSIFKLKNDEDHDIDETDSRKKEFIIFSLSIIATALSLFLLTLFIKFFYKPDTSQIFLESSKLYLEKFLPSFVPKTVERMQFTSSVLVSPFLLLFFYTVFKKFISKTKKEIVSRMYFFANIIVPILLFSIAYVGLAVSNFLYTEKNFFLHGIGKYVYSLVLFPLGVYVILFLKKEKYKNIIKTGVYWFSGLLIVVIFLISVINVNTSSLSDIANIVNHANPIFYPISQVMAGKTLLVNLTSQYGLYPIFLEPIFNIVGLSVLSVTSVMGVLLSLSFLFIFFFLNRIIKNKIILLLGFSTIVVYLLDGSANPYPYFQYWPIRTFFPCLLLLLSSIYFKGRNKMLYYALFIISALSILWNFDSGIMVFISWMLVLMYLEMYNTNKKVMITKIIRHIVTGIVSLGLVFAGYWVYSFLRSGQLPDLSLFFQYQKLFYEGFMMIALPFPHVWIVVVLIFLAGLLLSIKKWIGRDSDWKNASIFFLSILGIGLFSYYEGRSHDATFYLPLYLPIILLIIFADALYSIIVSNAKLHGHRLLFLMIISFILSSPLGLIYKSGEYYNWSSIGLSSFFEKSETPLTRNVNFIKSNTHEGEEIVILAKAFDGVYYGESHTRSVLDIPSFTEVFFKREADYIVDFLRCNMTNKVFVYPFSEFYAQSGNDLVDIRINQTIKDLYAITSTSSEDMVLLLHSSDTLEDCK